MEFIHKINLYLHNYFAACDDDECLMCGEFMCPYGEPLHLHHDGCPACYSITNRDEEALVTKHPNDSNDYTDNGSGEALVCINPWAPQNDACH